MFVPPLSQFSACRGVQRLVQTRMRQTSPRLSHQEQIFGYKNILRASTMGGKRDADARQDRQRNCRSQCKKISSLRYWFSSPGEDLKQKKYILFVNAFVLYQLQTFRVKIFFLTPIRRRGQVWKARKKNRSLEKKRSRKRSEKSENPESNLESENKKSLVSHLSNMNK